MARFWQVFLGVILALIIGHLLLSPSGLFPECPSVIERYILRYERPLACESAAPRVWWAIGIVFLMAVVSVIAVVSEGSARPPRPRRGIF